MSCTSRSSSLSVFERGASLPPSHDALLGPLRMLPVSSFLLLFVSLRLDDEANDPPPGSLRLDEPEKSLMELILVAGPKASESSTIWISSGGGVEDEEESGEAPSFGEFILERRGGVQDHSEI